MIKILITDKLAQEGIDLLNSIDGVEPVVKLGISEDELASIIKDYDGLIIRSGTNVTKKVLENPGKFRAVARAGVGVDNIDVQEATRKGVLVMNTPGGNTLSAAEHTMALMLAMSRNVVPACVSLKSGAWDRKKYMGNQLNSKTLGVIGLGRIGMAVAKMAAGFDMKLIGYDPFAVPAQAVKMGMEVTDDLERIYKEADFITVHVPKNEKTLNMIDKPQLAMMKKTARLVNCARGGIINEDALYDALEKGIIAGAALDVFPTEPPENTKFQKIDSCLVTPHLGASTQEAQVEVAVEAAQILADALKGGPVRNAINAPSSGAAMHPLVSEYAGLARRIGSVLSSIAPGTVKSVEVQYRGSIADLDISAVTTSFEIGLLQSHFDLPLNIVNVGLMAKERGISIDITKNSETKNFESSFTAKLVTSSVTRIITGSVFEANVMRIIEIDGYKVDITPEGTVIIIYNDDKPGVIGAVGTVCGKHGINICTMGVGQKPDEKTAILAVSLDKEPDSKVFDELKKLDFVKEVYLCNLN